MLLLFSFLFVIVPIYGSILTTKAITVDHFVLSQNWPPSVCLGYARGCNYPVKTSLWTIHGLWPDGKDGHHNPFFCNDSMKFDINKLKPIAAEMSEYWPELLGGKSNTSLWKHEWQKHGTCSVNDTETKDELAYFSTALRLYKQFPIYDPLANANIIPSDQNPYEYSDFENALSGKYSKQIDLSCVKYENKVYFLEARICLSLRLEMIDCQKSSFSKATRWVNSLRANANAQDEPCPKQGDIYYLPYPNDSNKVSKFGML